MVEMEVGIDHLIIGKRNVIVNEPSSPRQGVVIGRGRSERVHCFICH